MSSLIPQLSYRRSSSDLFQSPCITKSKLVLPLYVKLDYMNEIIIRSKSKKRDNRAQKSMKCIDLHLNGDKSQLHKHHSQRTIKFPQRIKPKESGENSPVQKEKYEQRGLEIKEINLFVRSKSNTRKVLLNKERSTVINSIMAPHSYLYKTLPKIIYPKPIPAAITEIKRRTALQDDSELTPWSSRKSTPLVPKYLT